MNLCLTLLPPKLRRAPELIELHNNCFSLWSDVWSKVYSDAGSLDSFKLDDFLRQDYIGCIHEGTKVLALWASTSFNIHCQSTLKHSYFKFYDERYLGWLRSRGIENVMSIEFLTVDPALRGGVAGASLARVMVSLGGEVMKSAPPTQALIATARTDVAAAHVAYEIGYECVIGGTLQRNFPCDLIVCRKENLRQNPDPKAAALVEHLWATRKDLTQLTEKPNAESNQESKALAA